MYPGGTSLNYEPRFLLSRLDGYMRRHRSPSELFLRRKGQLISNDLGIPEADQASAFGHVYIRILV